MISKIVNTKINSGLSQYSIFKLKIIDDTYGEILNMAASITDCYDAAIKHIIIFYTTRNQDYIPNIMKFIIWWSKQDGCISIQSQMDYLNRYNDFGQLAIQLEKYMILL